MKISDIRLANHSNETVTEAFDNPYPYRWDTKDADHWVAKADTPPGLMLVMFEWMDGDSSWNIDFAVNGRMGKSGKGDAFRTFATVVAVIKDWVSSVDLSRTKLISFSADKTADVGPSRSKLYKRFAIQMARQLGWQLDINTKDSVDDFFKIINPELVDDDEDEMEDGALGPGGEIPAQYEAVSDGHQAEEKDAGNIFHELNESRMWKQLKQLTGLKMSKVAELMFEQLLAMQIFASADPAYAAQQAAQIMRLQNFDGFRTSQPDLYNVLTIMVNPERFEDQVIQDVQVTVPELRLKRNLRALAKNSLNNSDYGYMMLILQQEMQDFLPAPLIQLRRQVGNWDRIPASDKKVIVDRLMLQMRERGLQTEYFEKLRKLKFT